MKALLGKYCNGSGQDANAKPCCGNNATMIGNPTNGHAPTCTESNGKELNR